MPLDGFTVARDDIDTVGAVGVGRVGGIGVWIDAMPVADGRFGDGE